MMLCVDSILELGSHKNIIETPGGQKQNAIANQSNHPGSLPVVTLGGFLVR